MMETCILCVCAVGPKRGSSLLVTPSSVPLPWSRCLVMSCVGLMMAISTVSMFSTSSVCGGATLEGAVCLPPLPWIWMACLCMQLPSEVASLPLMLRMAVSSGAEIYKSRYLHRLVLMMRGYSWPV
ncbi:hypothetical protein ElyMa_005965900 [Elysia marginata]|uniref:Secreted protein n=1 Tax=Elysia marginata TaxID=1093978 RepID=A0AAV4GBI7_9GAST|nr:hypothetical protein ElyMa_005965900 [Elysia marginata]